MMTIQKSQMFTLSLNSIRIAVLLSFFLPIALSYGQAIQIVAPNGLENSSGNDGGQMMVAPRRAKVLFEAEHFASDGIIKITSMAWRADEGQNVPFSSTDDDVSIRLSTTGVSSLSTRFESNTGVDELQVFRGPVTLSLDSGMQVTDFLQSIDFNTPFRYDPSAGNLLVDISFTGFSPQWAIDHQDFFDGKTRLMTGFAGSASAGASWSLNPVTQFTAVPVPEPTGLSMTAIAGSIISFTLRPRKRSQAR